MKRYEVIYESQDQRVWSVIVKADGYSDWFGMLVFWRGWWRKRVHTFAKDVVLSVVEKG